MATVYIIRAIGVHMIKIGITSDIERRVAEISSMSPVKLEIVDLLHGVGFGVEATVHELMYDHRSHGEWFNEDGLEIALRWFCIVRKAANDIAAMLSSRCDMEEKQILVDLLRRSGATNIAMALDAFVNETGAGVSTMDKAGWA